MRREVQYSKIVVGKDCTFSVSGEVIVVFSTIIFVDLKVYNNLTGSISGNDTYNFLHKPSSILSKPLMTTDVSKFSLYLTQGTSSLSSYRIIDM